MSRFLSRWFFRSMNLPDKHQIRQDLHRIHERRADIGLTGMISEYLFEPTNIFDSKARRRPKGEILFVLSYILLMFAVWAVFNVR